MKPYLLAFVLLFICIYSNAETVRLADGANRAEILSSSATEIHISYTITNFEKIPFEIGGKEWFTLRLPHEGLLLSAGNPELPVLNRSVIIDDQALMKLEVYDLQYEDISLPIAPSKGNLMRNVEPADIPFQFGEIYQRDEFYPSQVAELSEPYILRDYRGITVKTNPLAYNPNTQTLRIYKSYKVRLYADGTDTINTISTPRIELARAFVPIYENHFLNWADNRYTPISDSFGKIVVYSTLEYLDAIQPYVDWKRTKGVEAEIVTFSSSSTAAQIKAHITNLLNGDSNISFMQIVGDADDLATSIYNGGGSDPYYSLLLGSDNYPDIFVGRFSANNVTDVTNQVNKTIAYERDLNTTDTWLTRATGVASDQGPGDDNQYDYQHLNAIRNELIGYGYTTVDQIYDPDAAAASVTTALNNGRGLVNYTGHGWQQGWSTTGFNNNHVQALTNTGDLPYIMSVACLNGDFVDYWCFAEAWLRKSNAGAIGMYASSTNQSWSPPMSAQDETSVILRAGSILTLGGLFFNSSLKMIDDYGTGGVDMFRTWNIFGDASLLYRTKTPSSMTVSYPEVINLGTSSVAVSTGVAGALVSVSKDNVLIDSAYTNASGNATLYFYSGLNEFSTYTVTITGHDKRTWTGSLFRGQVWDGSSSTNWNSNSNWNSSHVPVIGDDVLIPDGAPRYPQTSSAVAFCRSLKIESAAYVTVNAYNLNVAEDMTIFGQLRMNSSAGDLNVTGDLNWESGSTASITDSSAEIYCESYMNFKPGSNVQFAMGYIEFHGSGPSFINNQSAATQINHLRSYKDTAYTLSFSANSTQPLTINGNIWNYVNRNLRSGYSGTVILKGNLYDYNSSAGNGVLLGLGTLKLDGISQTIALQGPDCYLKNLTVSSTGTVTVSNQLVVQGNLQIESGILAPGSQTIQVGGNWINNVGVAAFTEATSTVVLNGAGTQTMTTEDFNILTLHKATGQMSIPSGVNVTCNAYDWIQGAYSVSGGTFTVDDLLDPGIMGTITLSSGTINYTQDTVSYIDLRANLSIGSGTFNVFGGNSAMYFSWINEATLTMNSGGGILDVKDQGIFIPSSYLFNDNISAGTIRTSKGFYCERTDFNPTGGILNLYGPTDANLYLAAGSNLFKLRIDKTSAREDGRAEADYTQDRAGNRIPLTRSNTVTASSDLDINDYFVLADGSFIAPAQITIAGDWYNFAGIGSFVEGTGTVTFDGAGHQYCQTSEDFYNLIINKTGGALRLDETSTTVNCVNYTWVAGAVDVLLGTFSVGDLTQDGIYGNWYVNPNGVINIHQDAAQYPDLNGYLYNYGGTINIYGGSSDVYAAYSANAGITMTGGVIDLKNKGIFIQSTAYTWTPSITGGTLRSIGSLTITRAGNQFSGGTVELYGPGTAYLTSIDGNSLYNLNINKTPATRDDENLPASADPRAVARPDDHRLEGVYLSSNLTVTYSLTINAGTLFVRANTLTVYNDIIVNAGLNMTQDGSIDCGDDFIWNNGSVGTITAGTVIGGFDWYFNPGCSVNMTGSSTTLNADYDATIRCSSPSAGFGNLTLDGNGGGEGSDYQIDPLSEDQLRIAGNLSILAENALVTGELAATVGGNLSLYQYGRIQIGDGSTFHINGNLVHNGIIDIGPGTFYVHGVYTSSDTASLTINSGSFINDVAWRNDEEGARSAIPLRGAISLLSGLLEITHNSINVFTHASRIWQSGIVRSGGGFSATAAGAFQQTGGTLELVSNLNPSLNVTGGNYVNNLKIQLGASYAAYLANNLIIKGNFILQSGSCVTNNYNIETGGTWTNNSGSTNFYEGTSTITFNGSSVSTGFSTSETVYNLVINNSSTNWDNFELSAGCQLSVINDLTVTDGTLNMKNSTQLNVGRAILPR